MKVAVIGGGSTYTPELVSGFIANAEALSLDELWLMDIDPQRLQVVGGFAQRMVAAAGSPFRLQLTTDRSQALDGASFVETQIRVGGMAARHQDELLGRRWGLVGQETTGVGGFAKALRTIPVLLSVAQDMLRLCPQAWLVNFANPSGLVTEALQRYAPAVHSVGLCNSPIGHKIAIARELDVDPTDVSLDYLGLNHLAWLRGASVKGTDVWPRVFQAYLDHLKQEEDPVWPAYLAELTKMIPSGYLRYYYRTKSVLDHQAVSPTRAEDVMKVEADLLREYSDPNLTVLPDKLMLRGGAHYSTAACQLILSLHRNDGAIHVVNTRHSGAVPGWPEDWVAELPCVVTAGGPQPIPTKPLPVLLEGLVRAVKSYELLAAEAAAHGDRGAALQALVAHPLGPGADRAPAFFEDLLRVNAAHLPQFGG